MNGRRISFVNPLGGAWESQFLYTGRRETMQWVSVVKGRIGAM